MKPSSVVLPIAALAIGIATMPAYADLFVPLAPLDGPRSEHATVLLASGDALVIGGSSSGPQVLATVERFDSAAHTWQPAASLATARRGPAAALLASGKVLVAGGADGAFRSIDSAEIYDPATDAWTPTASLATARLGATATVLASGKVLVVGGFGSGGPRDSAELYDPESGSWSSAARCLLRRIRTRRRCCRRGGFSSRADRTLAMRSTLPRSTIPIRMRGHPART